MASRTKERITRRRPLLDEDLILSWADEHFRTHGEWPTARSGAVDGQEAESWRIVPERILPQCGGRNATRGRLAVATVAGKAQGEPDRGRKAAGPKYTELC